jgi:heavy metal translocating P-type ATPase
MQCDRSGSVLLDVRGMWCTSCANAVERLLRRQPGVLDAKVSFASESATLEWNPAATQLDAILAPMAKLGYECVPEGPGHDRCVHFEKIKHELSIRLAVALFFSMWVMMAQWTLYIAPRESLPAPAQYGLAVFAGLTTLPIVSYCALPFFRAASRTLRAGVPGMDFLVAMGASVSCLLSVWRLLEGASTVYFDSAAMIVTFLLAGRLVETTVRSKSSDAVRSLLELPPETARVIDESGTETTVLVKRVARGSTIRICPGERVPLDGVITEGTSSLDRSILTGETEFQTVRPGDAVEAGTLNGDGELCVDVRRVWGERRVDLIARSVRQMLARKTASQALAERFTRYLAPGVCVVAVLTLLAGLVSGTFWSNAIERAVSVLVITCPCALGMAVPLALSAGVGTAARAGVLFRDVEAIENACRIRLFFLDKTGTLTEGRPQLVGSHVAQGIDEAELIAKAAIAERGSEHPLALAVRACLAPPQRGSVDAPRGYTCAAPGAGIQWHGAEGTCILAGSGPFLIDQGVRLPRLTSEYTTVHIARNGQWLGALHFSDTPRAGAAYALARIQAAGADVAMLTGDRMQVALRIAHALGIDDCAIYASHGPAEKAKRIAAAQAAGVKVAFVGDGLNDAAALAAADFGVAVGTASASSVAAASVVLVDGGIEKLSLALSLARRTAEAMRQNLAAAAIYNVLAIPFAVAGWVSPALAAALMIASSLSVTLNASRLALSAARVRDLPGRPSPPDESGHFERRPRSLAG